MAQIKNKKTQISATSIGEKLKTAREEKGISLEEAQKITKIHPNVLRALEEDRLDNILGKTYIKSFLREYSGFLGLDTAEIISEYNSRYGYEQSAAEIEKKPILKHAPAAANNKQDFSRILIFVLLSATFIGVLSFAAVKIIRFTRNISKVKKEGLAAEPYAAAKKTKKEEKSDKIPEETINKEIIPIPQSRIITLTITTVKDVWLKVIRDGEITFQGILPKDARETWQADREIRLSEIGRPEALELKVNGKNIDFTSKPLGRTVLITHEGLSLEPK